MDSLTSSLISTNSKISSFSSFNYGHGYKASNNADAIILSSLTKSDSSVVGLNFNDLYKSLTIEAREMVDAINEKIADYLPAGVQSLKPEDTTPEATADRIVSSVTGLFVNFQSAHSNLDPEEVLNRFMEAVRSGVNQGYNEAFDILDGLGVFKYDGIQSGIEKTLSLVNDKLDKFEQTMRQQLGIDATDTVDEEVSQATSSNLLSQAGSSLFRITA